MSEFTIKRRMKTKEELVKYLINRGYSKNVSDGSYVYDNGDTIFSVEAEMMEYCGKEIELHIRNDMHLKKWFLEYDYRMEILGEVTRDNIYYYFLEDWLEPLELEKEAEKVMYYLEHRDIPDIGEIGMYFMHSMSELVSHINMLIKKEGIEGLIGLSQRYILYNSRGCRVSFSDIFEMSYSVVYKEII